MLYELPVSKNVYAKIHKNEVIPNSFTFFKILDVEDVLFVLVHGTPEGFVSLGNHGLVDSKKLLQLLIDNKGIKAKGIKEVITISCYGGRQSSEEIDGITIRSIHDSNEEIHTKVFSTIDDEYFLTISIKDKLDGGVTMSADLKYPCDYGQVCPYAIEPTAHMCYQCEDNLQREQQFNTEIKTLEEGLPMTTNQLNQMNADPTIKTTEEVVPMNTMTKLELRNAIEELNPLFVISNTAFRTIKRDMLVELFNVLPKLVKQISEDKLSMAFELYLDHARRGYVFDVADVEVTDGASVASANVDMTIQEASVASDKVTEVNVVRTVASVLPRAGIKDGVLGIYVNKALTEGIVDLSYAQGQIDAMKAEIASLEAKNKELLSQLGKQPTVVVEQAKEVPAAKSGKGPRYTAKELESMRAQAMSTGKSVTAVKTASTPTNGAYTKEQIEDMKKQANTTTLTCGCGGSVTKQNLSFLKNSKVQALLPVEYRKVALCWHCQQALLNGNQPFSIEDRKAGLHKQVVKANIHIK